MKKLLFFIVIAVAFVACGNQKSTPEKTEDEPKSEVLKSFADSVNNVAPMLWDGVGNIERVTYSGKEMVFIIQVPKEAMTPEIKKWFSSFIVNNVFQFGPAMQKECLEKACTMVFNVYTENRDNFEYIFKLTPSELKKKFAPEK